MPLRNRQLQIPSGLTYRQSETSWTPARYSSFDSIVDQLIAHRNANSWLRDKNGWATDRATVEMEVDNYNTAFCRSMGGQYLEYIEGGPAPAPPFRPPPPAPILSQISGGAAAVKRLASGAALLFEWTESGLPPVAAEVAEQRAETCSTCPMNSQKELGDWFTGPVSEGIRKKIGRLHEMNLTTKSDAALGICSACLCPMRLKVWTPDQLILKRLASETREALDPRCWILKVGQPNS